MTRHCTSCGDALYLDWTLDICPACDGVECCRLCRHPLTLAVEHEYCTSCRCVDCDDVVEEPGDDRCEECADRRAWALV